MVLKRQQIVDALISVRPQFESEGVKLLGFFGSYARGEATEQSDVDVLIETDNSFLEKYRGFKAYARLEELKTLLQDRLHKPVDLADRSALGALGRKYILESSQYV
jgi:predicted nucleotidyltransferase